ncbi:CRISPR-associated protein [Tumebacillus avium]|uniref:CRISPR-associated protein n=1 Tax=Tumebacillus avium TaxID=1903704 RepID=A0A1Y0IPN7_9BACL|nr:TIGR02710 family CRISPR-associated CARF protein [Tumebacillus avium]ARU61776.1 CRISPR-associated protein [Tumebacillus avium]
MSEVILIATVGRSRQPIVIAHQKHKPKFTLFVASKENNNQPGSRFSLEQKGAPRGKGDPPKDTLAIVGQYLLRKRSKETGENPHDSELVAVSKYLSEVTGKDEPSILDQLQINEGQYEIIELEHPDSISEAYKKISEQVTLLQTAHPHATIIIDITGGTKSMSAAGAMVASDLNLEVSVVTGVRTNLEKVDALSEARLQNYGVIELSRDIKRIQERFACRDYPAAVELCSEVLRDADRKSSREVEEMQLIPNLEKLQKFANAFKEWDEFEHDKAVDLLQIIGRDAVEWKIFGEKVATAKRLMQGYYQDRTRAVEKKVGFEVVYDLFFNAVRRGEQQKFDDAVARLYRTLEVLEQVLLINRHGIRTKYVFVSELEGKVSSDLKGVLGKKCDENGVFESALQDSFTILQELDVELRSFIEARMKTMCNLLGDRNNSILAHGFTRVEGQAFQKFQKFVYEYLTGIDELVGNKRGLKYYENAQFPREITL